MPDYPKRIRDFRKTLEDSSCSAALVADANNIRYLSGLQNNHAHIAYLIITPNYCYLVTDYRYSEQAKAQCPQFEIVIRDRQKVSLGEAFTQLLREVHSDHETSVSKRPNHLAFEKDAFSVSQFESLRQSFEKSDSGIELIGMSGWIERQRMIKDKYEIESIRSAATIADKALANIVSSLKIGISERDATLELEYQMQKAGSEGMAFDTIFLSGERSALPHGTPSSNTLQSGDLVTIDFGAVINGYRSDMTRALVMGTPNAKQLAVYQTVRDAQAAAIDSISSNIAASKPYFVSKQILDMSDFAKHQGEGIGHGVGLYLHEQPFLQANNDTILQSNMVITVEPGIYIPGWGGVRIEDDVVVTQDGCELLTNAPRDLIQIG